MPLHGAIVRIVTQVRRRTHGWPGERLDDGLRPEECPISVQGKLQACRLNKDKLMGIECIELESAGTQQGDGY